MVELGVSAISSGTGRHPRGEEITSPCVMLSLATREVLEGAIVDASTVSKDVGWAVYSDCPCGSRRSRGSFVNKGLTISLSVFADAVGSPPVSSGMAFEPGGWASSKSGLLVECAMLLVN